MYLGSQVHMGYSGIQLWLNHVLCGLISSDSQKAISSSAHLFIFMLYAVTIMERLRTKIRGQKREIARLNRIIELSQNANVVRQYQEEMDNLAEENDRQDYLISILIRDNMNMKALLGPS